MESPEIRRRKIKQERRKEKAERENQATSTNTTPDGGGGGGGELEGAPPLKKRKVKKKPVIYEDIIDGFAIRSFKTYEDLTRAVALESGQSEALNGGSQESTTTTARISGSGGRGGSGDNNKVGGNETPSKETTGKSSASTKSPKSKKKKLSTTNQENNSNVMQPDLSRCSAQSGDHASGGNGSSTTPSSGGTTISVSVETSVGMPMLSPTPQQQQSLNPSHAHSYSSQQQMFCTPPLSSVGGTVDAGVHVTALKPHSQQQQQPNSKKVRVSNSKEKDSKKNKSEDRKEVFDAISRKETSSKDVSCFVDNLHPNHHHHVSSATQRVNLTEFGINSDLKTSSNLNNNNNCNRIGATVATTNSTSTSTSIDHSLGSSTQTPVSTSSCSSSLTATAAVGTQFSTSSQPVGPGVPAQSHQNQHHHHHQKFPTPCRPSNLLPATKQTSTQASVNAIITSDPFGNGITIKREVPDVVETLDVKPFANGPLSPPKRNLEVNGHSQNNNLPYSLPQTGSVYSEGASSQTPFTPISQPSPKPVNGSNSLGQPAQQQVVAPVSNPKEKFGQGRIGSQTLFTPYATTAITRVRSPLGGGGPPAVVSSGSQSSATTVIQPESPKEPLVPVGSPYSSVSHLHHTQQPQPNPPLVPSQTNHPHNLKNNQIHTPHLHNHHNHPHHHHHHHHHQGNHLPANTLEYAQKNSSRVGPSSASNSNSSNSSNNNSDNNNSTSKSTNSSSTKAHSHHHHHHHHHHKSSGSGESRGQTSVDNYHKKDHTSEASSGAVVPSKSKSQHSSGSRSSSSSSRDSGSNKASSHTAKEKAAAVKSSAPSKPNTAFGSIARLLDSPTNSSSSTSGNSSSHNSSGGKAIVSAPHHPHHPHSHPHHHHPPTSASQQYAAANSSLANHTHHHHPHHFQQHSSATVSNPHSYSGPVGINTHSLQHPGSSSSSSANTALGCPPVGTPNRPSSGGLQQGATVPNNHTAISLATSTSTQSCSSRSHSPRGHSPTRERDSYSSNVSSLSRSSATPVSGSQPSSHLQLPPNLSPQLQSSSYSKAASWLSTVPGLSPVPRPTPPPTTPSSIAGHPSGGPLTLQPSPVNIIAGYPAVPPHHGLTSPHPVVATSNMFAPPILPLSTISSHPASQPPAFGPGADHLYPGGPTSSDIVRRDLESRLISGERGVSGGPSPFLTRPSDLHHHHSLLSPLSGVGHLPPHGPGAHPNAPHHSAVFPPNLFKDLPKLGMDSPFYRTNVSISYPGFNGILPPPGLTTPFAPPTQLPQYTQKKSGKWNAMHVRIAWEIYQHQQKGGSAEGASKSGSSSSSASSTSVSSSKAVPLSSSSSITGLSTPPTSVSSSGPSSASLTADLLRSSANHAFPGLPRPGEGHPSFSTPMMSPHAPPPHASPRGTPYDPLFLNSAASHLGPPIPRYPGFGALGPSFGGLSGLGSSLLGRDLSSLVALSPGQDQWARFPVRPPYPVTSSALGTNWPVQQRPEQRDTKTPNETSRRQKDSESERPSRHSDSREGRGRDSSPFRDRSPVRPSRTPLENGDGDSRSSRSNDSHSNSTSAVHSSAHSKSSGRSKEDMVSSNGDRDKTPTPILSSYERERLAAVDKSVPPLVSSHQSRMYPTSSPLTSTINTMSLGPAWDAFPGFLGHGPRMGLSLLQLSERERELARIPPPAPGSLRPGLFPNGPYGALPLGVLGPGGPLCSVAPPTAMAAVAAAASNTSKASPVLGGTIPLLSAGGAIPPSVSLSHSHSHIHSSQQQNGPMSPSAGSSKAQQTPSAADEKHIVTPSSHGSSRSSKEDSR